MQFFQFFSAKKTCPTYNYSFVGKEIKLTGSHRSSYADAFRQLNNT